MPDLGNPRDRVLPFLIGCGLLVLLLFVYFRRDDADSSLLMIGTGVVAFIAGALFMMAARREP